MEDLGRIRFLAANYPSLQGLKQVPFGLLAVLVSAWANTLRRPAPNLAFPILVSLACIALYLIIGRYYARVFGRVQRSTTATRLDWIIQMAGAILALLAFVVDTTLDLPFSTLGLVFAAVLLADYLRMTNLGRDRFLLYYPLLAAAMIALSLVPLFGPLEWWQAIGIKSPVLAVVMVFGLFIIIVGILVHLFLIRNLPPLQEAQNG